MNSFFIYQSAHKQHDSFAGEGKPSSKLSQVFTLGFGVDICVDAVWYHHLFVWREPKGPSYVRNHVVTAAYNLPCFVSKPCFRFVDHSFVIKVNSVSATNFSGVDCRK